MESFHDGGMMTAVFTPLNDDLSINYSIIPTYVKYVVDSGVKSVLVGGTTGEHQCLSVADRKQFIKSWLEASKSTGLHIQAQVGGAPLPDVLELARYCQEIGVDSLLTAPELYFRPDTVEELVFYVSQVAQAAPKLPLIYYHSPKRSKVEINMVDFVPVATASISNFKGIKYADTDISEAVQIKNLLNKDQALFLPMEKLVAPAALMGIKTTMCTAWSLFPKLGQDIQNALENNEVATARALQEKLNLAIDALSCEGSRPGIPAFKAGMEIVTGIKVGPPSLPQRPVSEEAKERIKTKLRALGLCK